MIPHIFYSHACSGSTKLLVVAAGLGRGCGASAPAAAADACVRRALAGALSRQLRAEQVCTISFYIGVSSFSFAAYSSLRLVQLCTSMPCCSRSISELADTNCVLLQPAVHVLSTNIRHSFRLLVDAEYSIAFQNHLPGVRFHGQHRRCPAAHQGKFHFVSASTTTMKSQVRGQAAVDAFASSAHAIFSACMFLCRRKCRVFKGFGGTGSFTAGMTGREAGRSSGHNKTVSASSTGGSAGVQGLRRHWLFHSWDDWEGRRN